MNVLHRDSAVWLSLKAGEGQNRAADNCPGHAPSAMCALLCLMGMLSCTACNAGVRKACTACLQHVSG